MWKRKISDSFPPIEGYALNCMYMSECVIGGGSQTLDIVSLSIRVSARNHYEPKRVILIDSNRFKADYFVFQRVYQKFAYNY